MIKVLSMSEFGMDIDDSSTKAPVMVIAFAGWNDAGGASTWAIRSLIEKTIATEILTFDSEEFYDFSRERPTVHLDGESRFLSWPKNTISLSNDGSLLLMEGVEPQLNWQTFTQNILAEAQKYNVSMIITLGSLLAEVPHSRPVLIHGVSENTEINRTYGLQTSSYEGPTGIIGVINQLSTDAGIPNMSFWATVPNYVAGAESPKAALALIERLKTTLNLSLNTTDLEIASSAYERQINQIIEGDEDTSKYVDELEDNYDAGDYEVASPEDFVKDVENFLRDQD
ncbi:MAG: proteasome assembly chaperone family protein [Acidimicrobiales bacterium]|jgi:predicted ATP-grasp superfamily ATP-dependent carboligase|tara:strand:- start:489 stop:1340 length:852 start_codon:yes stop_codon:yes gene_type:complete